MRLFLLLTLVFLTLASSPAFAVPMLVDVAPDAAAAAAGEGELLFLARRGSKPFRGLLAKRSNESCKKISASMTDILGYEDRFSGVVKSRITKKHGKYIDYELTIDAPFRPVIPGRVERAADNRIVFHDIDTGGQMTFRLHDDDGGCIVLYHLAHPGDKHSGFVDLIKKLEPGGADVGELVAALAVLRGYMPGSAKRAPGSTQLRSLERVADRGHRGRGIAYAVSRKDNGHTMMVVTRRIDAPYSDVVARLGNPEQWVKKSDVLHRVKQNNDRTEWKFGYLGGTVNVKTKSTTSKKAAQFTAVHKVVSGDIKRGLWKVKATPDGKGTRVELLVDADFTKGSFVLTKFADGNDAIRDAIPIELGLNVLVDLFD